MQRAASARGDDHPDNHIVAPASVWPNRDSAHYSSWRNVHLPPRNHRRRRTVTYDELEQASARVASSLLAGGEDLEQARVAYLVTRGAPMRRFSAASGGPAAWPCRLPPRILPRKWSTCCGMRGSVPDDRRCCRSRHLVTAGVGAGRSLCRRGCGPVGADARCRSTSARRDGR